MQIKKISFVFFLIALVWISLFINKGLLAQQTQQNLFYYVDGISSIKEFKAHADKIDIIAPTAYKFDELGVIWGSVDRRIISIAKENNIKVMPLVDNADFNQKWLHNFLMSTTAKNRVIKTLIVLCQRNGYAGIQFDCENLSIRDRERYTKFFQQSADSLHKYGFEISDAIVHLYDDYDIPTKYFKWLYENWRGGYDLSAIGKAADFVTMMSYAQHTRRTTPGPSAGLPWVLKIVKNLIKYIPADKISLGIPLGAQHWYTVLDTAKYFANARSWSDGLSYSAAIDLADRYNAKILWNDEEKVPYTIYDNGGLMEYIYFENARSFKAKYDLIGKYKLRGFSAWLLGREDPKIWDIIPSHR